MNLFYLKNVFLIICLATTYTYSMHSAAALKALGENAAVQIKDGIENASQHIEQAAINIKDGIENTGRHIQQALNIIGLETVKELIAKNGIKITANHTLSVHPATLEWINNAASHSFEISKKISVALLLVYISWYLIKTKPESQQPIIRIIKYVMSSACIGFGIFILLH